MSGPGDAPDRPLSELLPPEGRADPDQTRPEVDAVVRYFLIADVRGYTRFTQTHGDEAAAALAGRFAMVTREVVSSHQGELVELRGDEALVVFSSARPAIRAAVALQDRFVDLTLEEPRIPFTVGIGLDAGEAVAVEGGYRGGALNMAARLCSAAAPGQVLASPEIVHLAGSVAGVRYQRRGQRMFKGIAEPVRVVEVLREVDDPIRTRRFAEAVRAAQPRPGRRRTWRLVAVGAALAVLAATAVVVLVVPSGNPVAVTADSVVVVDAKALKVVTSVPVKVHPDGITTGHGSVWAVNESSASVSRLDPDTRAVVQTIAVGGSPRAVASDRAGIWVTNSGDRSVSWISPRTDEVVKTVQVGNAPIGIAAGRRVVWATDSLDDTVSVIDSDTGKVTATVPVGRRPTGIAVVGADVWVINSGEGTVSRIDAARREVTDTITVGSGPEHVTGGAGGVWVTNTLDGTVTRIDPSSGTVAATIPVPKGPGGITVNSRGVWVTSEYGGTLTQINPDKNQVVHTLAVGGGPRGVVAVGDALWVTAAGSPAAHRGGTLRVLLSPGLPRTIDPAADVSFALSGGLTAVNDGLVTYRRVGGPDGGTLVPDLATALPKPSDAGRVYTFHVRRGIRYSTGAQVRPGDFRRALERVFKVALYAPARDYYSGIVGAEACIKKAATCRLVRGVVADDDAGTVTIHLVRADGDFLNKLALPFSAAVPPGTPDHDVGTHPVPATGPYKIASFAPGQHLILLRNPMFREWSHAAQPDGYPDRISIGFAQPDVAVDQVERGQADLASPPPSRLDELTTRYADQLHTEGTQFVSFAAMNQHAPPFDDPLVRRAVAYALDREQLVGLMGGRQVAAPSCQLLPPTFPSYRPYCPFTQEPTAAGTWHAPDLAKARLLVATSRTTDQSITVMSYDDGIGDYLVRMLKQLGYHRVTIMRGADPFSPPPGTPFQIGYQGWGADYPAPSAVFAPLMSCESSPVNFCDRHFDAQIKAAAALQVSDPAGATVAWRNVERAALDIAVLAPMVSYSVNDVTSRRLGGYQRSAAFGPLLDQMWVKPSPTPPPVRPALHVDPTRAKITARIPYDKGPTGATEGDVWLPRPNQGQVWRIDGNSDVVSAKVDVGGDPERVAVGLGVVWVTDAEGGAVVRVDPATNRVTERIAVGGEPFGIAILSGRVWVAVTEDRTVVAIDPVTKKVTATRRFGPTDAEGIAELGAASGSLWVSLSKDDTVYRVDPTGRRPVTAIRLPTEAGQFDNDLVVGNGAVWRSDSRAGAVLRVDTQTDRITKIRVRPEPGQIGLVDGAVWVLSANNGDSVLSRIDPAENKVAVTVAVGQVDLWAGGGAVYAAERDDAGALLRIGP